MTPSHGMKTTGSIAVTAIGRHSVIQNTATMRIPYAHFDAREGLTIIIGRKTSGVSMTMSVSLMRSSCRYHGTGVTIVGTPSLFAGDVAVFFADSFAAISVEFYRSGLIISSTVDQSLTAGAAAPERKINKMNMIDLYPPFQLQTTRRRGS
jgi:hypothetical protein